MDLPRGDRGSEPPVRQVGLGHHHESRGVAVESVHDAGSAFGPARQRRAPGHERVHQGVVPVPRRRMDHEAGGLVDHREVLVLEHDVERDGGGAQRAGRLVVGNRDARRARRGRGVREARAGAPFTLTALVGDQAGGLGAREAQLIGEKAVEPLGGRGRGP